MRTDERSSGNTALVNVRVLGGALCLTLLMSGCGHSGSGFRSAQDVAAALGCQPTGTPRVDRENGWTLEKCTFHDERLAIYWIQNKRASFAATGYRGGHVWGGKWDVGCSRVTECVKAQQILGGTLVRPRRIFNS